MGKPGELKFEKLLKENINKLKLNNIKLMGRTKKAEKIIQNAFVVLRPSRWNDPWGRDVLDVQVPFVLAQEIMMI